MADRMRELLRKKPSVNSVAKKCERLAALEDQYKTALAPFERRSQKLEDLIEEATGPLVDQISLLEKEIKRDVLSLEETVDTPTHQVQYVNGRKTWDTRGLDGYMVAGHDELAQFRKVGNPSAKIKRLDPEEES